MSQEKKWIRKRFRESVFERDEYKCVICGHNIPEELDAHHITDRNEMPGGGYVLENGITLCNINCHQMAEEHHRTGEALPGFTPDDLYNLIASSKERAIEIASREVVRRRALEDLVRLSEEMGLYDEEFEDGKSSQASEEDSSEAPS